VLDPSKKFSMTGKITTEHIGHKDVLDGWFIHYTQGWGGDEKIGSGFWYNKPLHDEAYKDEACGICCVAMLMSTFIDRTMNPYVIGSWARQQWKETGTTKYYPNLDGGAIQLLIKHFAPGKFKLEPDSGIKHCSPYFGDNNFIKTAEKWIRDGGVVICSTSGTAKGSKNNLFTLKGHYIILFDYSKGQFRVGDSGRFAPDNRTKAFSEADVRGATKHYWLIKYKG